MVQTVRVWGWLSKSWDLKLSQWILENYGLQCFSIHSPYLTINTTCLTFSSYFLIHCVLTSISSNNIIHSSFLSQISVFLNECKPIQESEIHFICNMSFPEPQMFPSSVTRRLTCLGSHATNPETILDYYISYTFYS